MNIILLLFTIAILKSIVVGGSGFVCYSLDDLSFGIKK